MLNKRKVTNRSRTKNAKKTSAVRKIANEHPAPQQSIKNILKEIDSRGVIGAARESLAKPHYGTAIYIASSQLQMRMGVFTAHVFQDLIHKGYIIALAYGNIISAKELYTRIHSSCVTSETLRGCDCDCSKQLEGALEKIAEKKAGILFYLIQEGRGVGYIAKARDRMLVQASQDEISTFEAYRALGLKKDYRNYESIASISHLLGIKAPFIVLTNNPDKIEALTSLGLKVKRQENLEFEAGPYNLAYLKSKAESGHLLDKRTYDPSRRAIPPEPVRGFAPYAIPQAQRFIYAAKYFLPMKPVDGEIVVSQQAYERADMQTPLRRLSQGKERVIEAVTELDDERMLIKINRKNLGRYRDSHANDAVTRLLTTPYWFAIHAYYDLVSGQDFVVLTHGDLANRKIPLVRIHSESIFDRFPLKDVDNRDKFKRSANLIVKNGSGMIVLLYNDGRGAGFGAHVSDRMLREQGKARTSDESYDKLGIGYDLRDYESAVTLIEHHIPHKQIEMIMASPDSLVKKQEYAVALHRHKITVKRWIFLEE